MVCASSPKKSHTHSNTDANKPLRHYPHVWHSCQERPRHALVLSNDGAGLLGWHGPFWATCTSHGLTRG